LFIKKCQEIDSFSESFIQNGTAAPAFSLYSSVDKKVSLEDFKGKRIVLVFYPADWSPVCGDQLVPLSFN